MEEFIPEPKPRKPAAPWKPRPGTLARVKGYFQGYIAHGRDIYARRKHIAERLGISVRTLARYLAHLAAVGWIETVQRTARTAIRKVLSILNLSPVTVPSLSPPLREPPRTKVLLRKTGPPVPLVVFLRVYKRFARKNTGERKTKTKADLRIEKMRAWAVEETRRLEGLQKAVSA